MQTPKEQAYYLDHLTPVEALALLAEAVARPDAHFEDIRLKIEQSVFGATATLVIGIVQAKEQDKLVNSYSELKGSLPAQRPFENEGLPLASGLSWLLLNSLTDERDRAQPVVPGEYLLVGQQLGDKRAASVFEDLRFHATHTRVAAGKGDSGPCHLFHVLDDQERHSSFLSVLASGAFSDMNPLLAYQSDPYKLFLAQPPSNKALSLVVTILRGMPSLLGLTQMSEAGLLLAIDSSGPTGSEEGAINQYYLGTLSFYSQVHFVPEAKDYAEFEMHLLENSKEMLSDLRAAVGRSAPNVGYRLELRSMKRLDLVELERMRLLERQNEVAYKLAYLDSVSRPRPLLMRFSERQLPAFAEVIRSFPLEVLRKGYPRYGFQARVDPKQVSSEDAAGLHYLFIEPEDAVEIVPLLNCGEGPNAPTRFWLDPFWARYYHGSDKACLVFVPEQSALFPAMHGWNSQAMDQYLREILGEWFRDRELPKIPASPLYLFEGDLHPDATMSISVLDMDQFQPLQTRLGWINDHLSLCHALDLDRFIANMANEAGRSRLADSVVEKARQSEQALEQLLVQVNRSSARTLAELSDTVNAEYNQVLSQTQETTSYLKDLYDYLQELTLLGRGAESTAAQAFRDLVKVEGKYRDLGRFMEKLEQDIDAELFKTDKARQKMIQKVSRGVAELSTTHEALRIKLIDVLRMRG